MPLSLGGQHHQDSPIFAMEKDQRARFSADHHFVVAVSSRTFFPISEKDAGTDQVREGSQEGSDFVSQEFLLILGVVK